MTQEQLDTLTEMWCLTAEESLGDFELVKVYSVFPQKVIINIESKKIENISLPWEYFKDHYTPKEKAKIVISLLEQIRDNGEQWLRDEENYHGDKLAEKGDNDYKSNLEND